MNGVHNDLPPERYEWTVEVTIRGSADDYVAVARCLTAEGVGAVCAALAGNHEMSAQYIRVVTRRIL